MTQTYIETFTASKENLRGVHTFPMTRNRNTAAMDAPTELPKKQLQELGIVVKKKK
jgi:aspartyl-tRNA synthetase